jgi:hypothetical protein
LQNQWFDVYPDGNSNVNIKLVEVASGSRR